MFCDLDDSALLCLKVVSPGVSCVFVEPELSCCDFAYYTIIVIHNPMQGIHDELEEVVDVWVLGTVVGCSWEETSNVEMTTGTPEMEVGGDGDWMTRGWVERVDFAGLADCFLNGFGETFLVGFAGREDCHLSLAVDSLGAVHGPWGTIDFDSQGDVFFIRSQGDVLSTHLEGVFGGSC
jgi:hypothetical protein